MEKLPLYITVIFLAAVGLSFILLLNAARDRRKVTVFGIAWLTTTGLLAYLGYFENTSVMPPRLAFVMVPAILFVLALVITHKGKRFTDGFSLKDLTLLHIVRVPVELVLFLLAVQKAVPEIMTFSGRNFDVLSGLTAPVMYFVCFKNGVLRNRRLLLFWNFVCLGLLLNIVILAILAAPFPFQQFAFEQPNIAVLSFPFIWLPAFIVIIVLFSHLVAIRMLMNRKEISTEAMKPQAL